jgi:hypothetical protein
MVWVTGYARLLSKQFPQLFLYSHYYPTPLDLSQETLYNSCIEYYTVSSPLLVEEHLYTCKYAYDNI